MQRTTESPKVWSREAITGYLFIAPGMLLFFVFVFVPMVAALCFSFTRYDILHAPKWIGLKNYAALCNDALFWKSLGNTARYAVGTIPTGMALALGLALLLNRPLRGIALFRAAYYVPVVTSLVAVAMVWMWLYAAQNYGLLNYLLSLFGVDNQQWLGDPNQALPAIMAMSVWKGLGFGMVVYLAGLQGIPPHLYEAATIDGAGGWARFRHITWPLLKPTTFFLFVTSIIGASQVFGQVYVMTNGGPVNSTTTVVHQIFQNSFKFLEMGYASAMAFVLFVLLFTLSFLNWKFLKSEVDYS